MKISNQQYSLKTNKLNDFVERMDNLKNKSKWERIDCKNIRLSVSENADENELIIGESKLPPYLKEGSDFETILKAKCKDDPFTVLNMLKNNESFVEKYRYNLTSNALSDLIDRAKLGTKFKDTEFLNRNNDTLNDALYDNDEKIKVYTIEGTAFAIPSDNYVPISISELIKTLEKELNVLYKNVKFETGYYSHEVSYVDFSISDIKILMAYQKALKQAFFKPKVIIRMVTSNLGLSGVNLYPLFEYAPTPGSKRIQVCLGSNINMMHKGNASIKEFKNNINKTFTLVETLPEKLEKLDSITIKHPTHCLINVAEKCNIPAKYIAPIAESCSYIINGTTSARKIYLLLAEVVNQAKDEREKLSLSEKVGRAVRILQNPDDVDITKIKWVSLSKITADEDQLDLTTDNDDFEDLKQISFV